jgi:hypothetical protein
VRIVKWGRWDKNGAGGCAIDVARQSERWDNLGNLDFMASLSPSAAYKSPPTLCSICGGERRVVLSRRDRLSEVKEAW